MNSMSNYELKTLNMMSYYTGEPKVGIAKATGKLIVCEDEVLFIKQMGNAVGNAFGLIGMGIAKSRSMKQGNTMRFKYDEIAAARAAQYMGVMPMLVLEMKNGEKHSFAGMASIADCVRLIRERLA